MDFLDLNQDHNQQSDSECGKTDEKTLDQKSASNEQDQTLKCLTELAMWQDQCKRISAEFENFKRRTDRDKIRWAEIANEALLMELLSFVDSFKAALKQKDGVDHKGIEMIYQSLLKLLQKYDVVSMVVTQEFDPEFHEAVMQVQSDRHQSGQIVEVLSEGFMIKDRVLRPAKVSVAV